MASEPIPIVRSYHEYTLHLEDALSRVRCLKHLSRKDAYLENLDKQMSRCWNTSANCNIPSTEDRAACAASIGSIDVDRLAALIMPAMRDLLRRASDCQAYFVNLPLPPGAAPTAPVICPQELCRCENPAESLYCRRCGAKLPASASPPHAAGWQLPQGMVHGDEIIGELRKCIDDCKCLVRLSPDEDVFRFLDEQVQKMARFTRQGIHPDAAQRAELRLDSISADDLEARVRVVLSQTAARLAAYSHLYVTFPTELG